MFFEASEGYECMLRERLWPTNVRFIRANPRQARDIARAGRQRQIRLSECSDAFGAWYLSSSGSNGAASLWRRASRRRTASSRPRRRRVGLAPVARDSGKRSAPRAIAGGRPIVRTVLYIAALHASRWCQAFEEFRAQLQTAGKPVKAALIAKARKLLVTLNTMIATGTDYQPPEAA